MLELTERQVQTIAEQKSPLELINPATQEVFVLVRKEVYNLTCNIVGERQGQVWDDQDDNLIRKK
jgi:hypothetical protein